MPPSSKIRPNLKRIVSDSTEARAELSRPTFFESHNPENLAPVIYPRSEHSVSRSSIDPDALKIMYRLARHGYKAYLVGGGVRDLLLGKTPKDFDIATDATPRKIKNLFRNCRIIGRRFKLAHVYFRDNKIIEVSTFRDSTPQDEPEHVEGASEVFQEQNNVYGTPATDAFRRDLTINALFYELTSFSIIDFVGGMKDLQQKTIRIIGDPRIRYQEDPVRMIRVIRHAARANFNIEEGTAKAITENHILLSQASQVRVYEEFRKDLSGGAALSTLRLLAKTHLLEHLLPELLLNNSVLLEENSYFSQVISRIDDFSKSSDKEVPTTPILGIIALFLISYPNSLESMVAQKLEREELNDHIKSCFIKLTVPRKERERIEDLLSVWMRILETPPEKIERLNLERRKCLPELDFLLRWIGDDFHHGNLQEVVEQALHQRSRFPNRTRRGGSHRRTEEPSKPLDTEGQREQRRGGRWDNTEERQGRERQGRERQGRERQGRERQGRTKGNPPHKKQ